MEDEIENGKKIKNNIAKDVGPPPPSRPNLIEDKGIPKWIERLGKQIRQVSK